MFKRAAVTLFALIAMTFDHAVGGGGGGDKNGAAKGNVDDETNLFDLSESEEDEMDKAAGSAFKSGYVPCEKALIESLRGGERKNDTGQMHYKVSENRIQFCPNFCENVTVIHDFCQAADRNYVKAFSADVASERCCDSRKCVCICSFYCKTFKTKQAEMEGQGYKNCKKGGDKKKTVEKVQKSCQKEKKSTKCARGTRFLCPVQHVCVGKKCLACGNPSCVETKEKDAAETLIKAANSTDQKEAGDMEKVQKEQQEMEAKEARKKTKVKGWRTLTKKKNEGKVDVGISM